MPRPPLTSDEDFRWFVSELQPILERERDLERRVEEWRNAEKTLIKADKQALMIEAHEDRGLSRNAICRALGVTSGAKQTELWSEGIVEIPLVPFLDGLDYDCCECFALCWRGHNNRTRWFFHTSP